MVDSKLKLYYFGVMQGRAQGIRYALTAGGRDFEDIFPNEFPPSQEYKDMCNKIGGNTTTNIPMLVDGNKVYTQTVAVLLQAGRMSGLMPADEDSQYEVDKLVADADDLSNGSIKALKMFGAPRDAELNFMNNMLPKHVGNIERQLGDNEWFVGGKFSIADVAIYTVLDTNCRGLVPDCLSAFPKLEAFCKRFEALPKIAEYRASERFTKLGTFTPIEK